MPQVQHDPRSCALCDQLPPGAYGRRWKGAARVGYWHVIYDGADLMARLPPQAHFVTILSSRASSESGPLHYQGPLYFEADAADAALAFADVRRCVELLNAVYDCPLEAIHVWHSGGRGPHVTIPARVIGADAGHPQLPRIYAAMVQHLFPPHVAPTLDRGIYNGGLGRMWRLPNRRRADNGRYKVPLSMQEVLYQHDADIEALTYRPRKGRCWPSDDELWPCPALVVLYHDIVAAIERSMAPAAPGVRRHTTEWAEVGLLLTRCAFIRHCRDHGTRLSEPEWYAMVSHVARCSNGAAAVHRLSAPYADYSPAETDAKIAHALKDTGPHTCAFIQAQGFQGCPPGGCGVKAPLGLGRHAGVGRSEGLRVRQVTPGQHQGRTVPISEVMPWRS
jgi:hypothetical protein